MKARNLFIALAAVLLTSFAGSASASVIDVFARANSTIGGSGGHTGVIFSVGDHFSVSADPDDLWSAGALPRWSNADGLVADRYATGSDESGMAAGTWIGRNFGLYTQHGLSLPYGMLVGSIDGHFFGLGTDYSGNAVASGELLLWYWDSNSYDNWEDIRVTITTDVPEPGTLALMGLAMACFGFSRRKPNRC